ncbi:hypothetical protein C7B62_07590 [Pleurocapsa sp. CCALA 161]|nr:hypothetical protein C7B62_07590 [Pleurocapsa sp. CCALA 161]
MKFNQQLIDKSIEPLVAAKLFINLISDSLQDYLILGENSSVTVRENLPSSNLNFFNFLAKMRHYLDPFVLLDCLALN